MHINSRGFDRLHLTDGKAIRMGCKRFLSCLLLTLAVLPSLVAAQVESTPAEVAVAANHAGFTGLLLVGDIDQVLFESTSGGSQNGAGAALKVSDVFRFASITKQFTAVLTMQEVEAKKLELDAPFGHYWPEFPNEAARAATIRQLLMHFSGLANTDDIPGFNMKSDKPAEEMQAYATGVCARTLKRKPGAGFEYNNCDYLVLGALLERLNKRPFSELLASRIFKPAKMTTAGYYSIAVDDVATHVHGMLGGKPEPVVNGATYAAAGGAYGTVYDLLAFDRALVENKFMSAATLAEMIKPNQSGGALGVWSYPFKYDSNKPPATIIERQGWISGIRTLNLIDASDRVFVLVIATKGDLELTQIWKIGADLLRTTLMAKR